MHDLELSTLLAVSKIPVDGIQVESEACGIALASPPNLLHDLVFRHVAQSSNSSSGVQRIGGSNPSSRHRRSMLGRICVRDVSAVPSQKVLHAVRGGNGDVYHVGRRSWRNRRFSSRTAASFRFMSR